MDILPRVGNRKPRTAVLGGAGGCSPVLRRGSTVRGPLWPAMGQRRTIRGLVRRVLRRGRGRGRRRESAVGHTKHHATAWVEPLGRVLLQRHVETVGAARIFESDPRSAGVDLRGHDHDAAGGMGEDQLRADLGSPPPGQPELVVGDLHHEGVGGPLDARADVVQPTNVAVCAAARASCESQVRRGVVSRGEWVKSEVEANRRAACSRRSRCPSHSH